MAANTGQGKGFGLFLVGLTVGCAGIAYLSTGIGKVSAIVGAAIVLASLFGFLKIKPLEGATAQKASSTAMKLVGAVTVCLGWLVTIGGLHAASTVGGRLVVALIGIAVSLFGMLFVLPATFNKNAIWKA